MVIAKTPLRIPLAGGLSDIREYADVHGGYTMSATIDKYIYVTIKPHYDHGVELRYLNTYERVDEVDKIQHPHIREAIRMCGLEDEALELAIMNDLPHEGGLGSSGALSAALLSALHAYKGESVSDDRLIDEASELEMDRMGGASGYHDHSITHLGGLRLLSYDGSTPRPVPLRIDPAVLTEFKDRFMLFYSGYHAKTRPSLILLAEHMAEAMPTLEAIKENALALSEALKNGDLPAAGACIQRQQDLKQVLPGSFQNKFVVETMKRARRIGVHAQIPGGKIGSFLMVFRPKGVRRRRVIKHFSDLRPIPFSFVNEGTKVIRV